MNPATSTIVAFIINGTLKDDDLREIDVAMSTRPGFEVDWTRTPYAMIVTEIAAANKERYEREQAARDAEIAAITSALGSPTDPNSFAWPLGRQLQTTGPQSMFRYGDVVRVSQGKAAGLTGIIVNRERVSIRIATSSGLKLVRPEWLVVARAAQIPQPK